MPYFSCGECSDSISSISDLFSLKPTNTLSPITMVGVASLRYVSTNSFLADSSMEISFARKSIFLDERNSFSALQSAHVGDV